jgi:hypothetical protein
LLRIRDGPSRALGPSQFPLFAIAGYPALERVLPSRTASVRSIGSMNDVLIFSIAM